MRVPVAWVAAAVARGRIAYEDENKKRNEYTEGIKRSADWPRVENSLIGTILSEHTQNTRSGAFDRDGRWVVSGCNDR
jgi:hypothetical protein